MHVSFAILSEYVIEARDGKLSIVGIFDEIQAFQVPATFPRIFATIRIQGRITDGTEHIVRLVIVDEDGHEIVKKSPALPFSLKPRGPGVPMHAVVVADLREVEFPRFGDYEFNIFIDDEPTPAESVAFTVIRIDTKDVDGESG